MDDLVLRPEGWTEAEYLALDEGTNRIELVYGALWVSPATSGPHEDIAAEIRAALKTFAKPLGLRARTNVNLRLGPDTMVEPDVAVVAAPWDSLTVDASDALLVCEVTSPSNARTDRVFKKDLYAQAKIPFYLLVEPDLREKTTTMRLLRLDSGQYVDHAHAAAGETLTSELPFPFSLNTIDVLDL